MKNLYMLKILIGCILLFTFFSCSIPIGSPNVTKPTTEIHTTTGQELIDLKKALDAGAITQEEYEELKKKIMERKQDKEITKEKD